MNVGELIERLKANASLGAVVGVINEDNPLPYTVTDVRLETNEDADGSETLWIVVEES